MFIFLRLLLAHFIGDFPLQFDIIFMLKSKGLKGIIPHVLIIVFCCIMLAWPYLYFPQVWLFIAFIGLTHLLQDTLKIKYNVAKYSFWTYILDQFFHVGIIALVLLTSLKELPTPCDSKSLMVQLYCNDKLIIYLIALIIATYNGYFLIRCFKDTYLERAQYNNVEKWFGMFERALIVSLFMLRGRFLFLLPLIFLIRPFAFKSFKNKYALHDEFKSLTEIILSWSVALLTGIPLYFL